MKIDSVFFGGNEYTQIWLNSVKIWEKASGGGSGSDGELDSDGYVIVKYPASQKTKPNAWCALGNSITAGVGAGGSSYSYANVCANQQGISVINNYGIAGTCISAGFNTALTELGVETAFCNRFGEMSDGADLITVLGSVNDHGTDVKIGSPTSTDKNDFYGALYVLINGLKQKYPNGRIVFITPFKVNGWDGTNAYKHTLKDFRNAIVTQCNRFQIEVVDLFLQSQFDWSTGLDQGWFVSYDYYHPTAAGQQAIATYIGSVMFKEDSGEGEITIETANQGFNSDGSLDNNTKFTHTETYIPFDGNIDKIIKFGIEGWTRAIFYDSNKNRIGYTDSSGAISSLSMSELKTKYVNAVYVRVSINQTTTITLVGGSGTILETANKGFNPDGSLDNNTTFTHTVAYIPFSDNINKKVEFVIEGWTRAIFYDSNKNRIGYTDSASAVTYLSMRELQSISPNAVYVRISINKTTTITLADDETIITSPTNFDFSQENAVEYGSYGDYRTPPLSRAGYSKVTVTTEVAGYIGIIMFSDETTIMASYEDNYRAEGTFSITIPTDTCTYVAVKFAPSMIGHISAKLEV